MFCFFAHKVYTVCVYCAHSGKMLRKKICDFVQNWRLCGSIFCDFVQNWRLCGSTYILWLCSKIEDFVEVYFVTLFKMIDFVIKMLVFCSKSALYLLGENILQIENFMNLAKSWKSRTVNLVKFPTIHYVHDLLKSLPQWDQCRVGKKSILCVDRVCVWTGCVCGQGVCVLVCVWTRCVSVSPHAPVADVQASSSGGAARRGGSATSSMCSLTLVTPSGGQTGISPFIRQ